MSINRHPGFLPRNKLQMLLDALQQSGYQILGPVVLDGAIQFKQVEDSGQLVTGLTNLQGPGHYRLQQTEGQRLFDWNHGPQGL
ncbi:MAG: hypothetical protein ABW158_14185 [Candidatus Thiodiazotropha sp. 6PDIVS]